MIMVSSYTANLAAFLTVETPFEKITSVEQLKDCGNSDDECPVKFGAKKGGATANFFKESDHPTYKSMYKYMVCVRTRTRTDILMIQFPFFAYFIKYKVYIYLKERHPELMPSDNDIGVEMARNKDNDYAFLMESSSIEYVTERHCSVTQVGGLLDDKGYGIAMKKNAWYRNELSEAILQLQESGQLAKLKIKWWKEKRGGGACQVTDRSKFINLNYKFVFVNGFKLPAS